MTGGNITTQPSDNKYSIFVLIGAISYGILSTFVKFAYDAGFNLGEVAGAQILIGTVLTWIVLLLKKEKTFMTLNKNQIFKLMLTGIPMCLTSIFYYKCVELVPASIAILLLFQFTWIGNLVECAVEKKLPSKETIISMVLLIFGTVLASGVLNSNGNISLEGIFYGFLAAIVYTAFMYFNGKVETQIDSVTRTGVLLIGASIVICSVFPPVFLVNGAIQKGLLTYGLPLAIFGMVLPPVCFGIGVPKIGVGLASILGSIELPVATISACFVLKESVVLSQWVGVVIILVGVVFPLLANKGKNKAAAA